MVGEVSQSNDDNGDNTFLDPVGRFADDRGGRAGPHQPLWSELGAADGRADADAGAELANVTAGRTARKPPVQIGRLMAHAANRATVGAALPGIAP